MRNYKLKDNEVINLCIGIKYLIEKIEEEINCCKTREDYIILLKAQKGFSNIKSKLIDQLITDNDLEEI